MVSLSEKQENYTQIAEKAKNLIILAKSLNTIQIEDSLQALSRLDEAALTQVIQQKIQAYQQAQNKKNASNPNDNNFMLQDRDNSQNQQTFSGSWYFYNPAALSYGDTEFKRKWGNRTLSDHWRRRDKTIQEENSEQETTEQDPKNLNTDPSKKEYYLQNIKKTAADFDASDKKIREALFAAGNIYYDFINEKTEAKNIYNQIIKRFPQSEEALESLYRQYIMAYEAKQNKEAEAYKNEIIGRFPESSRAKSLKDPNYLERQRNARGYSETNYAQAFEQYNRGQYQQSLNILNTALAEYPDNHLGAKMRLLSAMNNGKQQLLPQYIDGLRLVIKNYPTGPEAQLAKDMLVVAEKGRISGKPIGQIYANHPTDLQQAAIWLKADKAQVGQIKFEIAKFNGTYDQRTNFSISEYPMQQGYLLAIRPFANQTDAQNYLLKILATPNLKQYLSDTPSFSIDQTNLETLGKDKDPQLYLEYLNKP
jgi:TolA-binding protein